MRGSPDTSAVAIRGAQLGKGALTLGAARGDHRPRLRWDVAKEQLGVGDGTARTRVRTRHGRWLVCHASCLRRPDGGVGDTALVIEPAQPAAIAPIVVEAYALTEREHEIIGLIARGAGTEQIADDLFLSRHTVRDHVKAIFAKVGVSSRGELVAKLFADFYEPVHAGDVSRG